MNRVLRPLALLAVGAALCAATPRVSLFDDAGTYRVYQGNRSLGTESFSFETYRDSVFVFAHIHEALLSPTGVDSLEKHVAVALSAQDLDLRGYESKSKMSGHSLRRTVSLADTSFTAYIESDSRGEGRTQVRPPGHMYVLEPRAFALFDLIFRVGHGSSLDDRTVHVLYLGVARDTVIDARVRRLGTEAVRWGTRTVQAQKISFSDSTAEFLAWLLPDGRMMRLTQPGVGLRVEREPPGLKRP